MRADNKHCMWRLPCLYKLTATDNTKKNYATDDFTHTVLHFLLTKRVRVDWFMEYEGLLITSIVPLAYTGSRDMFHRRAHYA